MKDIVNIKFIEDIPKYIQISNYIKKCIDEKNFLNGEKLPTIRELSEKLKVNKITIVNSYKRLESEGYAYQKVGSGTFVKRREIISTFNREYSKIIKDITKENLESIIDFTGETSNESYFPIKEFKVLINEVLDRDEEKALIMEESLGYKELRKTINQYFWNNKLQLKNILIVSGAQQGIDIASKAILNINDNVIVEKPTYNGAISVFNWRKANIFKVEIEEDGINLKVFEEILKKNKVKLFYTMSYFHNPTGITYSYEKKVKILELAEKYDFYIIEDDYLSEFIYDENMKHEPFKKLDENNRVIYIKSFSKVFLSGIRLGYMAIPNNLSENMKVAKKNTDIATSSLMQRALELYIKKGFWKSNIDKQFIEYKEKYNIIKGLIDEKLKDKVSYLDPKGGINFNLKIESKSITSIELFYKLKENGVYITPGVIFFNNSKEGNDFFRIGISQVNKDKIIKGIEIIKENL
ncbi:PLP-dependent aminotransferase family protein [Clostridium sp.]|uniref:MocR-like pyridoxine biosynthesis transcription factor PdxR n=1 Tax=Clostridium sp. TaxID=1506 RepID=UPI002613D88E|nr:PLP-dependent aminotransferase family protein [Clostridium sp.]